MDGDGYRLLANAGLSEAYASNSVEVATGIWKIFHEPSGHWHRLKHASGAKRCHFLHQEATWLTNLQEHGAARVYNLYEQGSQALLVTDFLNGTTLAQRLRSVAGGESSPISSVKPLFDLMSVCHSQSIVHCDIKPNNILVDEQEMHLIDFANAGRIGEPLADRPYRGFSPTYSLPSLQQGIGHITTLMDWFGFLIVLRLMSGERPPVIDWQVERSIRVAFEASIGCSGLPETDKAFLHVIVDQLVSQKALQVSAAHAVASAN